MTTRKVLIGLLGAAVMAASAVPASAQYLQEYTTPTAPPSGAALNRVNERIDQLEQQLRTMTGTIEQNEYTIQQMKTNQEKELGDMKRILQDLQVRLNSSGAASADTTTSSASSATTTTAKAETPTTLTTTTTATTAPSDETATAVTASGTTPEADPNGALATAPSVKPLGSVTADGSAQPGTPESEYETAYKLLSDKDYTGAQTAFAKFVKAHPNHDLAGNAQYWLGESYYARKDYKNAARVFAEGYQKYRKAPKAADNLVKLGLSLQALGSKDDACVTFQQFKKEYADAPASLKTRADTEIKKLSCGA